MFEQVGYDGTRPAVLFGRTWGMPGMQLPRSGLGENAGVPPCIDVYALVPQASAATTRSFLAHYVDAQRISFEGLEVSVLRPEFLGDERQSDWNRDWYAQSVASLEEVLVLGLGPPPHAFRIYLPAVEPLCGVILCFTRDGDTILGLSVDDPLGSSAALASARSLCEQLVHEWGASHGWAVWEDPPSLSPFEDRPWDEPGVAHSIAPGSL